MGLLLASAVAQPVLSQDLSEARRIEIAERLKEGSVGVEVGRSGGSGFVTHPDGWIVTNAHVIGRFRSHPVQLQYGNGSRGVGRVVFVDPRSDLAIIRPESRPPFKGLSLSETSPAKVGQTVLAFGNPFGLEGTLTQGIISAVRDVGEGSRRIQGLIQTDAPINPGNSGGPLVDSTGRVIGVNTAILARSDGIGFAIPVHYVRQALDASRRAQKGTQAPPTQPSVTAETTASGGWLGVYGRDFDRWGIAGAQIERVVPGSPAQEAGILGLLDTPPLKIVQRGIPWTGFVIVSIDDERVRSMADLVRSLRRRRPGDRARLAFVVGPGSVQGEVEVRLGRSPAAPSPNH